MKCICIGGCQNDGATVRQGVARGSPGGRQRYATPAPQKIYYRRPKSPPTDLALEPLDASLAAQALIFEHLLINFTFFDRILVIVDGFETDFQSFQYLQTSIFAIPYSKFKGFCM